MEENERGKILTAEYEEAIRFMKIQLEVTKEEHKNLKDELLQLIAENEKLTCKLDLEYRERIKLSEEGTFPEVFKSEIVSNLQCQLDLCKREKEKTLDLYKTSLKLIEKLEEEISSQKGNSLEATQSKVSVSTPIVAVLEGKLKNAREHLELAMNERDKLEGENIKHQTEIAKLKLNLESNNKIIEELKSREGDWRNKCRKWEQDCALLNATLECVTKSRNELEKKLDTYEAKIRELLEKNNESRRKVEEALDVVEKALTEKESATAREIELKDEINKLHMCLEHVIEEAGRKVGAEVDETRKKYETDVKNLTGELSQMKEELEKKKEEHKRLSFKYKKLEKLSSAKLDREKISLIKGSETEITLLENHLDSVYQELERFKAKYEEAEKEKKKLEEESSELIEKHRSLMKDQEEREASFEEMTRELRCEIEGKIEDLNEATKRCEFFLNQVRELQEENRNLAVVAGSCSCNKLKEKIKKLNEMRTAERSELESHVESQMKLNENWKSEMKEVMEKLEEAKKECKRTKGKNKKLAAELMEAKKKIYLLEKT